MIYEKTQKNIKEITKSPPQALVWKTNIQKGMFLWKSCFLENQKEMQKGRRPVKANEHYSRIQNFVIVHKVVQVLFKELLFLSFFRYCLKGPFFWTCFNYSSRFARGVQKEEIQQWWQARSRPGEKETLNICWGKIPIQIMKFWKVEIQKCYQYPNLKLKSL